MNELPVYVLGYARTPFGRFGGALCTLTLPELGAHAVSAAMKRSGVSSSQVDEVAFGVNFPGGDRSVARQVQLSAGIPDDKVSYTIDRACCSSLSAVNQASRSLRLGDAEVAVGGGVENLSRVPYFIEAARFGKRLGDIVLTDQLVISCPYSGVPRAVQASNEAAEYGIGRSEQDAWAHRSQQAYARALARGFFDDEVAPMSVTDGAGGSVVLLTDEPPRPDSTIEALGRLRTVNGSSTVTAGNAPDLSSGATAIVLSGRRVNADQDCVVLLEGWSMTSGDPQRIASMPAKAAQQALKRTGLSLDDVDVLEINEAFAAVPLVSTLVLAGGDASIAERLRNRTNINGGAVAIGHPTGATGARLVMTTIAELRRRGGGTGLVSICGGIGEAEAVIVRVDAP